MKTCLLALFLSYFIFVTTLFMWLKFQVVWTKFAKLGAKNHQQRFKILKKGPTWSNVSFEKCKGFEIFM